MENRKLNRTMSEKKQPKMEKTIPINTIFNVFIFIFFVFNKYID